VDPVDSVHAGRALATGKDLPFASGFDGESGSIECLLDGSIVVDDRADRGRDRFRIVVLEDRPTHRDASAPASIAPRTISTVPRSVPGLPPAMTTGRLVELVTWAKLAASPL